MNPPRHQAAASPSVSAPAGKYTGLAILLHWLIAVLIVINAALGTTADWMPATWVRPVIDTHKSIGITVLGLAILRLLWRLTHRPPPLVMHTGAWSRLERAAAHITHFLLYALMFMLPLSGWIHDSAWIEAANHPMYLYHVVPWPRIGWVMSLPAALKETVHDRFDCLHTYLGYGLYALLALHIAGALKHEWIDRDSVIRRMLP